MGQGVGWSWHKIARARGVGLGTVQRAAHKRAESNARIRAVTPLTHAARKTSAWRMCGSGLGVDASSRRDSASGVSSLPLNR